MTSLSTKNEALKLGMVIEHNTPDHTKGTIFAVTSQGQELSVTFQQRADAEGQHSLVSIHRQGHPSSFVHFEPDGVTVNGYGQQGIVGGEPAQKILAENLAAARTARPDRNRAKEKARVVRNSRLAIP